jgi:hypothetical protein
MGSCDLCKGREIWTIGYLHWPVCPTCGEKDHGPFEPDGVLECHNPKCATFNQIVGRVGREQLEEKLMDLSQGPFIDLDTQNLEELQIPVEGGIVWQEEAAAMGGSVLCTEWADLKARVGQASVPPHGPSFVLHLGPFQSEYDAKMFAEKCLKARFFEKIASGEAQPMEGHHGRPQSEGWPCHSPLLGEAEGQGHQEVQDPCRGKRPASSHPSVETDSG